MYSDTGVGFGIFFIASYVAIYYNTIMAWSLYYVVASMKPEVPWSSCWNTWNDGNCSLLQVNDSVLGNNASRCFPNKELNISCVSAATQYFE